MFFDGLMAYISPSSYMYVDSGKMEESIWASLKSSDYYWPKPEPVTLRATGQVSTLTELELYPYGSLFFPNL